MPETYSLARDERASATIVTIPYIPYIYYDFYGLYTLYSASACASALNKDYLFNGFCAENTYKHFCVYLYVGILWCLCMTRVTRLTRIGPFALDTR